MFSSIAFSPNGKWFTAAMQSLKHTREEGLAGKDSQVYVFELVRGSDPIKPPNVDPAKPPNVDPAKPPIVDPIKKPIVDPIKKPKDTPPAVKASATLNVVERTSVNAGVNKQIRRLAFAPQGNLVLAGSEFGLVQVFKLPSGDRSEPLFIGQKAS